MAFYNSEIGFGVKNSKGVYGNKLYITKNGGLTWFEQDYTTYTKIYQLYDFQDKTALFLSNGQLWKYIAH